MKPRTTSIIGWICVIPVAAFNLFAAIMKFIPQAPGSEGEKMGQLLGVAGIEHALGVIELIIVALYVVPRTSTVGFVLMIGYMGGALATNLTHGLSTMDALPVYITFVLMTIGAYFRNPELLSRMMKGKV